MKRRKERKKNLTFEIDVVQSRTAGLAAIRRHCTALRCNLDCGAGRMPLRRTTRVLPTVTYSTGTLLLFSVRQPSDRSPSTSLSFLLMLISCMVPVEIDTSLQDRLLHRRCATSHDCSSWRWIRTYTYHAFRVDYGLKYIEHDETQSKLSEADQEQGPFSRSPAEPLEVSRTYS